MEELRTRAADDAARVRAARAALAVLRQPDLVVTELQAGEAGPGATGHLYRAGGGGRWYLHATGLARPAEGHTLVLWLFTADGGTLAAGRLGPDAAGEVDLVADLPNGTGKIVRALVSDEPGPGAEPISSGMSVASRRWDSAWSPGRIRPIPDGCER